MTTLGVAFIVAMGLSTVVVLVASIIDSIKGDQR